MKEPIDIDINPKKEGCTEMCKILDKSWTAERCNTIATLKLYLKLYNIVPCMPKP
mgnify:FL=1